MRTTCVCISKYYILPYSKTKYDSQLFTIFLWQRKSGSKQYNAFGFLWKKLSAYLCFFGFLLQLTWIHKIIKIVFPVKSTVKLGCFLCENHFRFIEMECSCGSLLIAGEKTSRSKEYYLEICHSTLPTPVQLEFFLQEEIWWNLWRLMMMEWDTTTLSGTSVKHKNSVLGYEITGKKYDENQKYFLLLFLSCHPWLNCQKAFGWAPGSIERRYTHFRIPSMTTLFSTDQTCPTGLFLCNFLSRTSLVVVLVRTSQEQNKISTYSSYSLNSTHDNDDDDHDDDHHHKVFRGAPLPPPPPQPSSPFSILLSVQQDTIQYNQRLFLTSLNLPSAKRVRLFSPTSSIISYERAMKLSKVSEVETGRSYSSFFPGERNKKAGNKRQRRWCDVEGDIMVQEVLLQHYTASHHHCSEFFSER